MCIRRYDAPLLKNDHPSKKLLPAYSTDNWYVVAVVYVGRVKKYVKRGSADNTLEIMVKGGGVAEDPWASEG